MLDNLENKNGGPRLLIVRQEAFNSLDQWHGFLAEAVPGLEPEKLVGNEIALTISGAQYKESSINEKFVDYEEC